MAIHRPPHRFALPLEKARYQNGPRFASTILADAENVKLRAKAADVDTSIRSRKEWAARYAETQLAKA